MNKRKTVEATIILRYSGGDDEPERRVFRNYPLLPDLGSDLMISVNQLNEASEDLENPFQLQVHIAGTSRGLEELGTYLIALARLDSSDPEPYGSFDDIPLSGGGTIRLLPRRVPTLDVR
ncbi:MAG TPA: hypothetical protein VE871_12625 [Longimicrobium sp.]|nr:hypothetical protein [Longimicrobium sp.]